MKRLLYSVIGLLALAGVAWGAFWTLNRPEAHAAKQGDHAPFLVQPAGAGESIEYQPSEIPIRSLVWSRPLPGNAAVAQLLTQSNCQQALLFIDGNLNTTLTLDRPQAVAKNVFDFAELEDAALVPGQDLLLLYRTSVTGELPVLVAWDLQKGAVQWVYRGAGTRLVLSPQGHRVFLFGPGAPVQILDLRRKNGTAIPTPTPTTVDLPPGMVGPTDLLPTGASDFLATEAAGLAAWKQGAWIRTPAPAPSPLGFAAPAGTLARAGSTLWWQPEPGQLLQVAADGSIVLTEDLTGLIQGSHAQDASLFHLLGTDPRGGLWFAPVAPGFQAPLPPAVPVPVPAAVPVPDPAPAALKPPPGTAVAATPTTAPSPAPPPAPTLQDSWTPYLKAGLDRLYRWKPGSQTMQGFSWTSTWKQLGAPSFLEPPTGDGGLVPASGGFLLGGQERRWWLPLTSVPLDQPR